MPSAEDRDRAFSAVLRDLAVSATSANRARAAVLADALQALERDDLPEPDRLKAVEAAHQVVGSAGTFGYHHASEVAASLEQFFRTAAPDSPGRPGESAVVAARHHLSVLQAELAADPGHQDEG